MGREEEVREIAHKIWEAEGQPEGHDQDHWQRAEAIWQDRMEHLADDQFSRTDIVMPGSAPMRQAATAPRPASRKRPQQRAPRPAPKRAQRAG